jgi:hypothetical protein
MHTVESNVNSPIIFLINLELMNTLVTQKNIIARGKKKSKAIPVTVREGP